MQVFPREPRITPPSQKIQSLSDPDPRNHALHGVTPGGRAGNKVNAPCEWRNSANSEKTWLDPRDRGRRRRRPCPRRRRFRPDSAGLKLTWILSHPPLPFLSRARMPIAK